MRSRIARSVLAVTAAVALAGCYSPAADPATWTLDFQPAALAPPVGSGESQITVSPSGAILSWIEDGEDGTATVRFAERTADGWSEPGTVVSGEDWFRSYADMPAVLRLSSGTLVASWLPATDLFIEAYDLALAYSTDDGVTWSAPFMPHHDGTTTQHGLASMIEMPDGGLGLVWLDGRQQELDLESPEGGSMELRFAEYDTNWVQTADMVVDDRVCECCPTSLAFNSEGVITAYRDRTEAEIRDIHVARFVDGAWTPSATVHDDNWEIDACPVNGPAVTASGDHVAVAWFAAPDAPHAFVAFSEDGGRSFGDPVQLDDGTAMGRVGLAMLGDGSVVATWLEFVDQRAQVRVRRVDAAGARSPAIVVAGTGEGRATGYPRLAVTGDTAIVAWTETRQPGEGEELPTQRVVVAEATLP